MRQIASAIGVVFAGSLFLSSVVWTQQAAGETDDALSSLSPDSSRSSEQKAAESAALAQKESDANTTKPAPETQTQREGEPQQTTAIPLATAKPTQQQTLVSSKALVGVTVKNLQGEKLGTLQELMIDPQTGRIVYATLASGTVLGMGGKPLDIPWEALKVALEKDALVVEVDTEKLNAGSPSPLSQR